MQALSVRRRSPDPLGAGLLTPPTARPQVSGTSRDRQLRSMPVRVSGDLRSRPVARSGDRPQQELSLRDRARSPLIAALPPHAAGPPDPLHEGVSFCDTAQPRQGRHSLASGVSHWMTRDNAKAPEGRHTATDGNARRLHRDSECAYKLCRPSGARDDFLPGIPVARATG